MGEDGRGGSMKQCIKCERVKFEFLFFITSISECDYVERSNVCKSCAKVLTQIGVARYEQAYKKIGRVANTPEGWKIVEGSD